MKQLTHSLVRFGSIRGRAADQGGAILSVQGITWILLRAIGISDQQLIQLLAPFNGLFPSTEAEYTQLKTNLRRMGHILERTPGNLRDGLRSSQIASSAFLTHDEPWNPEPTQWGARASETHGWSGESAFAASASCSSVDAFATFQDDDIDTDSNTSSGECSSIPDDGQDPNAVAQRLFWAYKQAKHKWRKYMGKSTRAVRRYAKHFDRNKGKGKGKSGKFAFPVGKGKGKKGKHLMTAMLAEMTDDEVQQALPAFRGNQSPGKGKTDASLRSVQACHAWTPCPGPRFVQYIHTAEHAYPASQWIPRRNAFPVTWRHLGSISMMAWTGRIRTDNRIPFHHHPQSRGHYHRSWCLHEPDRREHSQRIFQTCKRAWIPATPVAHEANVCARRRRSTEVWMYSVNLNRM